MKDVKTYSVKDLQKAFEAGGKLEKQVVHIDEFCLGKNCWCKGKILPYNDFEEWNKLK